MPTILILFFLWGGAAALWTKAWFAHDREAYLLAFGCLEIGCGIVTLILSIVAGAISRLGENVGLFLNLAICIGMGAWSMYASQRYPHKHVVAGHDNEGPNLV